MVSRENQRFSLSTKKEMILKFSLYGYFDQIMRLMLPNEQGWTGLAYCYNMYTGWYEDSPWVIEDLQIALKQFESIDRTKLCDEAIEILMLLCNMLKEAILNNYEVSIARE